MPTCRGRPTAPAHLRPEIWLREDARRTPARGLEPLPCNCAWTGAAVRREDSLLVVMPSRFRFRGDVDPHVERFESDFPDAEAVPRLLKEAGASPIWLAPVVVKQGAPAHSWQVHVRLPGHLEEHFGFTRQILLYCLCTDDVHPRDGRRIQTLIRGAADPIAGDFASSRPGTTSAGTFRRSSRKAASPMPARPIS